MSGLPSRPKNPTLELLQSFKTIREWLPLAIGTHKVIRKLMPDLDDKQLRLALKLHTGSTRYLKSLANGDKRFDLEGNPAGEITAEQKQQALDCLKDRFKKKAEQHRVEQATKQKIEEQQQRQQKLLALVKKFGR